MRIFAALIAGLAWALAACSQPVREPAIWRISDADSEIWLYGTVHVLPPEVRWRGPEFEAAFAAADELVTETDASEAAMASFPALAMRLGALPAGETLSSRLGPEDRARLERIAERLHLDRNALDRLRPWLAALQLSYAHAASEGHSAEAGVETVLLAEARAGGKRISFLEAPEQQVHALADLSSEDELRFLSITLRQIEEDTTTLDAMDRAWARGDARLLGRMLDVQWEAAGPGLHEAIILRRNRAWADAIAERLNGSGRIFVAVGAAHLLGEDSVVDLLRERGIEVEGP